MHQIFWYTAKTYPRQYVNQVLHDACQCQPLPEMFDQRGNPILTAEWDEIVEHAKQNNVECHHIESYESTAAVID